jgi:hypothetical protein
VRSHGLCSWPYSPYCLVEAFSEVRTRLRYQAPCLRWKANPPGKRGKGGVVQVFTKFEVQETITDREKVMELRQVGGRLLRQVLQSGKVRASGVFADARGGFFVLEVDSSEELFDLFSAGLDYIRIETHALTTAEKLQEFFERDATAAAG